MFETRQGWAGAFAPPRSDCSSPSRPGLRLLKSIASRAPMPSRASARGHLMPPLPRPFQPVPLVRTRAAAALCTAPEQATALQTGPLAMGAHVPHNLLAASCTAFSAIRRDHLLNSRPAGGGPGGLRLLGGGDAGSPFPHPPRAARFAAVRPLMAPRASKGGAGKAATETYRSRAETGQAGGSGDVRRGNGKGRTERTSMEGGQALRRAAEWRKAAAGEEQDERATSGSDGAVRGFSLDTG